MAAESAISGRSRGGKIFQASLPAVGGKGFEGRIAFEVNSGEQTARAMVPEAAGEVSVNSLKRRDTKTRSGQMGRASELVGSSAK